MSRDLRSVITTEQLQRFVQERFGGVLRSGSHTPNSHACALEAYSQAVGHDWTDDPAALHMPDLRPLNDAQWSGDAARTAAMIPLVAAYSGWATWTRTRRQAVMTRVVILTIQRIVSALPGLSPEVATACRAAKTLSAAAAAAAAAAGAAAGAAEAAAAGADRVLQTACALWIEAAA
jgi:hypothetical protein